MRTNFPIVVAVALLVFLFIYSCSRSVPAKVDERELRDYPSGKAAEKPAAETADH